MIWWIVSSIITHVCVVSCTVEIVMPNGSWLQELQKIAATWQAHSPLRMSMANDEPSPGLQLGGMQLKFYCQFGKIW